MKLDKSRRRAVDGCASDKLPRIQDGGDIKMFSVTLIFDPMTLKS